MAYLVAAFAWWAILLTKRNTEIYNLKKEYLVTQNKISLQDVEKEYSISKKMVMGEGLVFAISILIGLLLINRAFWSELKLNKRLNNFLLSVTHELKTPITSLKIINKTISTKSINSEQKKELLKTAEGEINRLESLVNNILTAAQMESAYTFNFERINLSDLVSERTKRYQKINLDIKIENQINNSESYIKADKEALIKLIDNLVDNAIKYSKGAEKVIIKINQQKAFITLSVIDFGKGIKNEERDKIMSKFYRTGDEEVRETKGTGLGLFIVKEIAIAHKAKLSIHDNPEGGTIFKLDFPILKA